MTTRNLFSLSHLIGTLAGIVTGLLLPWWISGVTGWAGLIAAFAWYLRGAEWDTVDGARRRASHAAGFGWIWGAFSGALAVDAAEALDLLTWPGHDDHGYGIIVALVVSLAWAIGDLVTPDDEDAAPRPFRPGRVGLVLYLVIAALTLGPGVWEVL